MSVKNVLRMGHPILKQIAEPVTEFNTQMLDTLVKDMLDTMDALDGAGLAAPQIAVSTRVVIFGIENNPRYPDVKPVPQTVLINPCITILDNKLESLWEGCLSIPGMRGLVARAIKIEYSGSDQYGNPISRIAEGFHARVVLHEVDHLDGILYPQRITDLRNFGFDDQINELQQQTR